MRQDFNIAKFYDKAYEWVAELWAATDNWHHRFIYWLVAD